MDEEMNMAMGEAETVDPVSGNDVPPGSLPEEVRDDIDAKLSEGEYVVPADVVRFFGVKFFEDLRAEAKQGLTQMDADGRIGGDPTPVEPEQDLDSEEIREIEAMLSETNMNAGGLASGTAFDNFISDASSNPMVNGRMRANGMSVNMAVGGVVQGTYDNPTKIDNVVQRLLTAVKKDPNMMARLSSKGINVNKTKADEEPEAMKQVSAPVKSAAPVKAYAGMFMQSDDQKDDLIASLSKQTAKKKEEAKDKPNPFDFGGYDSLGGSLFNFDTNDLESNFTNPAGELKRIVLIDKDGNKIPVAWNTAMPIPDGFREATPEELSEPDEQPSAAPTAAVSESAKETGDDGPDRPTRQLTPSTVGGTIGGFQYEGKSVEELSDHYRKAGNISKAGLLAAAVLGPIGLIIGIGAKANMAIVKREIENELKEIRGSEKYQNSTQAELEKEGNDLGGLNSLLQAVRPQDRYGKNTSTGLGSKLMGFIFDPIADRRREQRQGTSSTDRVATTDAINKDVEKVKNIATENKRIADEAARKSAQVAADAQRVRGTTGSYYTGETRDGGGQYFSTAGGGSGYTDSSGTNQYLGGGDQGWTNPGNERAKAQRNETRSRKSNEKASGYTGGGKYGGFESGGLVSLPAVKQKNKKQTTQRRKGLGTRP